VPGVLGVAQDRVDPAGRRALVLCITGRWNSTSTDESAADCGPCDRLGMDMKRGA
jgi:hypothetical protein